MANISSAHGTLTLVGDWTQEDINAFLPVLDCWEFYGQYGIQSYYTTPTEDRPKTDFHGCGRWSFSGTLASFDEWTRDWIQRHDEPLSAGQYEAFLRLMAQRNLSIQVEFNDVEEGVGFDLDEVGQFTSDGETLTYEALSCQAHVPDWKERSRSAFNSAVDYFLSLAPDAEEDKIKKWVRMRILPTDFFEGFQRYGAGIWGDYYGNGGVNCVEEEDMQLFRDMFHPDSDAWDETVEACSDELGWELNAQDIELFGGAELHASVRPKTTVLDGGGGRTLAELEDGMSLSVMAKDGVMMFSVDDLENREGADVPIRGMLFRLSPEGVWSRVANDFDLEDCGHLAGKIAALEARFGGKFRFAGIFQGMDDEEEGLLEDYFNFLQEAMELLLYRVKLHRETGGENSESPHFLDSRGNEYFTGPFLFVVKIELSFILTDEDGEEIETTEEQRERFQECVTRGIQADQLEWTEEDEAWYEDWDGGDDDEEPDWPTVELDALDFQGKRFVLTGTFQNAPSDRDQIKAKIEARGGKCTSSVSGRTDYLVLGDWGDVGAKKVEQAQEQQKKGAPIQIISESTLFEFLR